MILHSLSEQWTFNMCQCIEKPIMVQVHYDLQLHFDNLWYVKVCCNNVSQVQDCCDDSSWMLSWHCFCFGFISIVFTCWFQLEITSSDFLSCLVFVKHKLSVKLLRTPFEIFFLYRAFTCNFNMLSCDSWRVLDYWLDVWFSMLP